MAEIRIRVNVVQAVIDSLVKLPEVQADLDRRSLNVLRRQESLVPVDTGHLRSRLGIKNTPDGGRQIGAFDVDYAAAVELGWQHARSGKWIPGQPYIRPSIDAARD